MHSGDHGNQWNFAKIELTAGRFTLYIEGYAGDGDQGDIAVDDFALFARHCDRVNQEFWSETVSLVYTMYVSNFGDFPPYAGELPGRSGYTIKKLFCTEGVLERKRKELGMSDEMEMEKDMDGGESDDPERGMRQNSDEYKDNGDRSNMMMDPYHMMMMSMTMAPPTMSQSMMPGTAYGPNYNMMMYQQYMVLQKMKKMKKYKMEKHKKHCEMEKHKKEVLHHLEMACMNDTITSKYLPVVVTLVFILVSTKEPVAPNTFLLQAWFTPVSSMTTIPVDSPRTLMTTLTGL